TPEAWPLREGLGGVLGYILLHWAAVLPQMVGLPLPYEQVGLVSAIAGGIVVAFALGFSFREWRGLARACRIAVGFVARHAATAILFLYRKWQDRRDAAPARLNRPGVGRAENAADITPREPHFRRASVAAEPEEDIPVVRTA